MTRGQMAAFIGRAAGRVEATDFGYISVGTIESTAGTAVIRAGDVPGGTANVLVHVDFSAYTYTTPSDAVVWVRLLYGATQVSQTWIQVPHQVSASYGIGSSSISAVVPVPTGVDQSFSVMVRVQNGASPVTGFGSLTATYIPFDGDAGNPSILSASDSGTSSSGQPPKR